MRKQLQVSLLRWSSKLLHKQILTLNQIQTSLTLLQMLHCLQPSYFGQTSQQTQLKSLSQILSLIKHYYQQQLSCNLSQIINSLNIFKSVNQVWELLIGIAIRGKNRDHNINVILGMGAEQQANLMMLVQEVIIKYQDYDIIQKTQSEVGLQDRKRSESIYSKDNINQLVQQMQQLKQQNDYLSNEVTNLKSSKQKNKQNYQQRISTYKNQRYEFLDVLTGGTLNRKLKQSKYNPRQSINSNDSNESKNDVLNGLRLNITGSLAQVAKQLLNQIKKQKNQIIFLKQKLNIFQEQNNDLKVSMDRLINTNKNLKQEIKKLQKLQKQLQSIKKQNSTLLHSQTQLLRDISQIQKQKLFLREMVDKLKIQKNQLLQQLTARDNTQYQRDSIQKDNNQIEQISPPSLILRQISGNQFYQQSMNLNNQINNSKQPGLKLKYQKQINELKYQNNQLKKQNNQLKKQNNQYLNQNSQYKYQNNEITHKNNQLNNKKNQLRNQNNELKSMNKMLQKTIQKSMQKTLQIQQNIQKGYQMLFKQQQLDMQNNKQLDMQNNKQKNNHQKQKNYNEQQNNQQHLNNQQFEIIQKVQINQKPKQLLIHQLTMNQTQNKSNQKQLYQLKADNIDNSNKIAKQKGINLKKNKSRDNTIKKSKLTEFYKQIKILIKSYQQKQLLMIIQIESLRKQLNDTMHNQIQFIQNEKKYQNISKQNDLNNNHTQFKLIRKSQLKQIKQHKNGQKDKNKQKDKNEQNNNQQFMQIKQGQQLPQTQIMKIKSQFSKKTSIFQQPQQIDISQIIQQKSSFMKPKSIFIQNQQQPNFVQITSDKNARDKYVHKRSMFAKSSFYNQSFIQLSNKLQDTIQTDINHIKLKLQQKITPKHHETQQKSYNKPQQINTINSNDQHKINSNDQHNINSNDQHKINSNDQDVSKFDQDHKEQLLFKLDRIKQSFGKIKQFHIKNSSQVYTQLQNQQTNKSSQVCLLKLQNQSLRESLTKMTLQKSLTSKNIHQLKHLFTQVSPQQPKNIISQKLYEICLQIQQLDRLLPQMVGVFSQNKVKEVQIMYQKQRIKNFRLNQELNLLIQTIVYFRNMAIDDIQ